MTRLKLSRLNQHITLVQLEKKSQVKRWKIQLAENGHKVLTESEIQRLARVLEFYPDELFMDIT